MPKSSGFVIDIDHGISVEGVVDGGGVVGVGIWDDVGFGNGVKGVNGVKGLKVGITGGCCCRGCEGLTLVCWSS